MIEKLNPYILKYNKYNNIDLVRIAIEIVNMRGVGGYFKDTDTPADSLRAVKDLIKGRLIPFGTDRLELNAIITIAKIRKII